MSYEILNFAEYYIKKFIKRGKIWQKTGTIHSYM